MLGFIHLLKLALGMIALLTQSAAAAGAAKATVDVLGYEFHQACFVGAIDTARETDASIVVRIAIEHKRNAGDCGCSSAALKAHIYVRADNLTPSDKLMGGQRHVQTTAPFSNALGTFEFSITKRRSHPSRDYSIWLTCGA